MRASTVACDGCSRGHAARVEEVIERRALLRLGLGGASALLAACGARPHDTQDNMGGSDPGGSGTPTDDGGQAEAGCSTASQVLNLSFSQYPQLSQVGGSVTVSASGYSDPTCRRNLIIVAQVSEGSFVALSASCTHQCCPVSYLSGRFFCPCHGSTFNTDGTVAGGPARRPLQRYDVCSDGSSATVVLA